MQENSNIQAAQKYKRQAFWLAAILSVMLVGGVPMIVLGAVKHVTAVMVIGIVFVVLGFYGAPIAWVRYGMASTRYALVQTVETEGIHTVQELSMHLGKKPQEIVGHIRVLIEKRCLVGYGFDGETLMDGKKKMQPQRIAVGKCPSCGAMMEYQDGQVVCPYCGYIQSSADHQS